MVFFLGELLAHVKTKWLLSSLASEAELHDSALEIVGQELGMLQRSQLDLRYKILVL